MQVAGWAVDQADRPVLVVLVLALVLAVVVVDPDALVAVEVADAVVDDAGT